MDLVFFSVNGNVEQVERCLARRVGCDPSDALLKATISGKTEVVKLLLAHPNINVNVTDHSHTTPLLWALALSRNEIVNLLLASPGIDVHSTDKEGDTALTVASKYGNLHAVKTILSFPNVDIKYVDFDNKTARGVAEAELQGETTGVYFEIVQCLLAAEKKK